MKTLSTTPPAKVVITSQSDMMENYSASSPVSCTQPISTVLDSQGNPIVLSIGTDKEAWIIYRDAASPTGWSQQDLTTGLAPGLTVVAMSATQAPTGQFCIAIAVAPTTGQTSTPVYVTGWLPNDLTSMDWAAFPTTQWVLRTPVEPLNATNLALGTTPVSGAIVTRILMGTAANTATPPLVVVAATQNGIAGHWFINGNASDASWSWAVYPMPEDAETILDMAVGFMSPGGGVLGTYVLYSLGGQTQLVFTSASQPVSAAPVYTHFFTGPNGGAPNGARCLAVLADPAAPHYTNLYVGGAGVTYFDHSIQSLKVASAMAGVPMIAAAGEMSDIQQMILAQDSANVSLWVLDQLTQNLSYTTGPQNSVAGSVWAQPLVLQGNVAHIAAQRHPGNSANMIVTALSDDKLAYQWQDPTTTLWRSTSIPLTDLVDDPIIKFSSYTTHIHLADENQNPLIGIKVNVTASQWAYVTINGFAHQVGPDTPATVQTDVMGNLTIILQTETVSTPIYQVGLPDGPAIVNPADNVVSRLSAIKKGTDLQAVKPDLSDATANFSAQTIQQLLAYMAKLPANGSPMADSGTDTPDQTWGGTVSGTQVTPATGGTQAVLAMMPHHLQLAMTSPTDLSVVGAIEGIAGDVLKLIQTEIAIVEAIVFSVVKGVVKFAIKIAGQWIYVTLLALGDVLEVFNWLLTLIGFSLSDLIQWLGFVFGWSDIITTAAVFNNLAEQTFDMVQDSLGALQKGINAGFDELLKKVDSLGQVPLLPTDVANTNVTSTASSAQPSTAQGQQASSFFSNSAGGNFIYYQVLHGGVLTASADDEGTGTSALTNFVQNTLMPTLQRIDSEVTTVVQTLLTSFKAGTLTIGEVLKLITKSLTELVIELMQTITDGLFTIADIVLASMETSLFGSINIPFLTAFYKLITNQPTMSLASGATLLVAIPASIAYKIASPLHQGPFANGTYGLDTDTWQQILATLRKPAVTNIAKRSTLAITPASANAAEADQPAGTSHGDFGNGVIIYTQIGGIVSLVCVAISEVCGLVQLFTEGESKIAAKVAMAFDFANVCATFPLDSNLGQEILGGIQWGGMVLDAIFEGCMFFVPKVQGPLNEDGKPLQFVPQSGPLKGRALAPVLEVAKGGYEVLEGIVDLVDYGLSFGAEMWKDDPSDRSNDVYKFLQNLCGVVATTGNGVTAVLGDENAELWVFSLLPAAFGVVIGEVLGGARVYDSIQNGTLFQPT